MKRYAQMLTLLTVGLAALLSPTLSAQQPAASTSWRQALAERLPLLGHRNWILIVDSAYPLQTSPGIEVIETNANQIAVTRGVLAQINNSIHVRPTIFLDAELPYLAEEDSPGANAYRREIADVLNGYEIQHELHDKLIATVADTARDFKVLVLKTNLAVPYTSVFIRLDAKYVSDDAEHRLRARMKSNIP